MVIQKVFLSMAALASISTATVASMQPALAADKDKNAFVSAVVEIKAPPEVVWKAVHEERKHDPDLAYSKVLQENGDEALIEQKMVLIPVIGAAVNQIHQKETLNERIDYKLVKSDRFKAMEGSWVLDPVKDGTKLTLSTHIDIGMPVPKTMMNSITQKKIQKRLNNVKSQAETMAKNIAQANTTN
ncbi:MAG: SRPBCC family protein [Candidatus Melainabacteria bacterium]|nr:SRPBCC family protein [Candidatus Melainabacteria bacterium]MBX9674054.1 SRPBCC family protein [Candidatus Obscuribacterales bacterium]